MSEPQLPPASTPETQTEKTSGAEVDPQAQAAAAVTLYRRWRQIEDTARQSPLATGIIVPLALIVACSLFTAMWYAVSYAGHGIYSLVASDPYTASRFIIPGLLFTGSGLVVALASWSRYLPKSNRRLVLAAGFVAMMGFGHLIEITIIFYGNSWRRQDERLLDFVEQLAIRSDTTIPPELNERFAEVPAADVLVPFADMVLCIATILMSLWALHRLTFLRHEATMQLLEKVAAAGAETSSYLTDAFKLIKGDGENIGKVIDSLRKTVEVLDHETKRIDGLESRVPAND